MSIRCDHLAVDNRRKEVSFARRCAGSYANIVMDRETEEIINEMV